MFELDFTASIRHLTVAFVPLMLGIILHEVAHGWMALRRGDATAAMLGRLTLNPFPHIDPLGLFVFVITKLQASGEGYHAGFRRRTRVQFPSGSGVRPAFAVSSRYFSC